VMLLADLAILYIWWQALRTEPAPAGKQQPGVTG